MELTPAWATKVSNTEKDGPTYVGVPLLVVRRGSPRALCLQTYYLDNQQQTSFIQQPLWLINEDGSLWFPPYVVDSK